MKNRIESVLIPKEQQKENIKLAKERYMKFKHIDEAEIPSKNKFMIWIKKITSR